VQACWTAAIVCALVIAVDADADMRVIVLIAAGVQIAAHVLQIALLARVQVVDPIGTLLAEAWTAVVAGVWYIVTTVTTHAFDERGITTQFLAGCAVVALLGLATWVTLPHLPAGRALSRHGIPVAWRPGISRPV
jgi:hypothetical protein